jgi:RNA polymerase sigma-70 factor (ECF subfamily)
VLAEGQLTAVLNVNREAHRAESGMAGDSAVDADAELMLRFQAGDIPSFDALVSRHRKPLLNFVYRMVQDAAAGEELVQETFLRVYLSRSRYQPTARFSTWLYRIAGRLTLNYLRDHRRDRQTASLDEPAPEGQPQHDIADRRPSVEERMLREERNRHVRKAVALLPERQRLAVVLHKYEELDYREIGKVMEMSESATKSLLFRAYETLRRELGRWLSEATGDEATSGAAGGSHEL